MSEIVTSRFTTTGMHCPSCAALIQMTVEDLPGVESVRSDYPTGITEVRHDAALASDATIIAEIVKVGYGAELADPA